VKNFFIRFLILLGMSIQNSVYASNIQLGFGGFTPHFGSTKKNYCNQWNNTGIIVNKSYSLRVMGETYGFTYLVGNDSICSDIEGILFHFILEKDEWIEYGITVGGYAYDEGNWVEHAEKTPDGIDAPEPVQFEYFGRRIVPMLALDVGVQLIKRDNWSLLLRNLFTPVIFNHSLAVEYRF
jgi:hypothetical protein